MLNLDTLIMLFICSLQVNFLFTTDVAEEGLHIPDCSYVIRFDLPKTVRSYVQSCGRARQVDSHFVIMLERYIDICSYYFYYSYCYYLCWFSKFCSMDEESCLFEVWMCLNFVCTLLLFFFLCGVLKINFKVRGFWKLRFLDIVLVLTAMA